MDEDDQHWPSYFPKDCPPSESDAAQGQFYRVILERVTRSIKAKHFLSQRESQPNRIWPPDITECELCAISLMKDIEDAQRKAQSLVNTIGAFRESVGRIALGTLTAETGKIEHTPDRLNGYESHHDWWKREAIDPLKYFEDCDVVITRK